MDGNSSPYLQPRRIQYFCGKIKYGKVRCSTRNHRSSLLKALSVIRSAKFAKLRYDVAGWKYSNYEAWMKVFSTGIKVVPEE